jgi:hypothetical protein
MQLIALVSSAADGGWGMPVIHHPGEAASMPGIYRQLNIFGSPTGMTVHVGEGEPLPAAPGGFTWQFMASGGASAR